LDEKSTNVAAEPSAGWADMIAGKHNKVKADAR
jgi:hypothetical protein